MSAHNLFIIGNGFDVGHHIQSEYSHFRAWLISEFDISGDIDYYHFGEMTTGHDGSETISDKDLARFIVSCIDITTEEDWCQFETALGNIDWMSYYDDLEDVLDDEGDIEPFKTACINENRTSTLFLNSDGIAKFFSDWINTLDVPRTTAKNPFLTNELLADSIFLTFNYTDTLETVYQIPTEKVNHIHGEKGQEIIVGHGNDFVYDTESANFGMGGLNDIHNALRKPTEYILESSRFFKELPNHSIDNIYSWGFSFSPIDLCYIEEICRYLDTAQITWHLHDYKKASIPIFTQALRSAGFKGKITTFHA